MKWKEDDGWGFEGWYLLGWWFGAVVSGKGQILQLWLSPLLSRKDFTRFTSLNTTKTTSVNPYQSLKVKNIYIKKVKPVYLVSKASSESIQVQVEVLQESVWPTKTWLKTKCLVSIRTLGLFLKATQSQANLIVWDFIIKVFIVTIV